MYIHNITTWDERSMMRGDREGLSLHIPVEIHMMRQKKCINS